MSIPFFVLVMIGIIVLFIVFCIYDEKRFRKETHKAKPEPTQVEKETESFENYDTAYKYFNNSKLPDVIKKALVIEWHNEMNDAVKFTQELINQGL